MMSLTFGLFTQVSGSGPLGPLVRKKWVFEHLRCRIFRVNTVISRMRLLKKEQVYHFFLGGGGGGGGGRVGGGGVDYFSPEQVY